jgi:chemotaxis protein CheD
MFPGNANSPSLNVGNRNGVAAKALLQKYGISLKAEYLFGVGHRQVIFDVASGDVWSKQVKLIEK